MAMVVAGVKFESMSDRLKAAAKKGSFTSFRHAGASIRRSAIDSMVFAKGPSKPGSPPHAHTGRLRRSIVFSATEEGVVVGPAYSQVVRGGRPPWLAKILEHGGVINHNTKADKQETSLYYRDVAGKWRKRGGGFASMRDVIAWQRRGGKEVKPKRKKRVVPARPFMAPALARASKRFMGKWKSSIS